MGSQDRNRLTASPMSNSFRRTTSARTGTICLGPLVKIAVLDVAKVRRIQVAGDRTRLEADMLVFIAAHDHSSVLQNLVAKERRGAVEDDEVHRTFRHDLEICHKAIDVAGRRNGSKQDGNIDVARWARMGLRRRAEQVGESHVLARLEYLTYAVNPVHASKYSVAAL